MCRIDRSLCKEIGLAISDKLRLQVAVRNMMQQQEEGREAPRPLSQHENAQTIMHEAENFYSTAKAQSQSIVSAVRENARDGEREIPNLSQNFLGQLLVSSAVH